MKGAARLAGDAQTCAALARRVPALFARHQREKAVPDYQDRRVPWCGDGAGKARGFRLLFVVLQQLRHGIGQRAGPQIVVQGLERAQGGIAQGLRFFGGFG